MYTIKALTVAVAGLVAAVNASPAVVKRDLNHVTTWSNSDCSGNSEFVYTDVSQDFCFEGAGGASFSDFGSTCGQGGGFVRYVVMRGRIVFTTARLLHSLILIC